MKRNRREWIHEGVFYGRNGSYVGSYYSNGAGWWVKLPDSPALSVPSRRSAIATVEIAEGRTTPGGTGEKEGER